MFQCADTGSGIRSWSAATIPKLRDREQNRRREIPFFLTSIGPEATDEQAAGALETMVSQE
jgi:hypothetical protein